MTKDNIIHLLTQAHEICHAGCEDLLHHEPDRESIQRLLAQVAAIEVTMWEIKRGVLIDGFEGPPTVIAETQADGHVDRNVAVFRQGHWETI